MLRALYSELAKLGANMKIIDIGGGLSIDYEDSISTVVARMNLNPLVDGFPKELMGEYQSVMAYTAMGDCCSSQICAEHMKARCLDLFKEGRLGLEQLATMDGMCDLVSSPDEEAPAVCHVNLSIFKSIPDFWAIAQLFPVMPIHRLNEWPTVRAILSNLTCDSDGKVDTFIFGDDGGGSRGLPLHPFEGRSEPYYLRMFLGWAYQEALGELHNLFGVPNVVHVVQSSGPHCFAITRALPGQTSVDVLDLMMHEPNMMFTSLKCCIEDSLQLDDDCDLDSAISNLNTIASTFKLSTIGAGWSNRRFSGVRVGATAVCRVVESFARGCMEVVWRLRSCRELPSSCRELSSSLCGTVEMS